MSADGDIAAEILQLCDGLPAGEAISLNPRLQNELLTRLAENKLEEEVWDTLLPMLSPDEIADAVFDHLLQNKLSLLTLCHMPLQDEWLLKLTAYDDAPLHTLAKRYYLSDAYSASDFARFYDRYLRSREDIALHLLDIYGNVCKRSLLIRLCSENSAFAYKEELLWHSVADRVRSLTDSTEIAPLYREYRNAGTVLAAIAANSFTPEEILRELQNVKGIANAKKVRKNAANTLQQKRIAAQKMQ